MLFFVAYLFVETLVSVNIASSLGGFNTFLEIIFSAFLGIVLFKNVGFSNASKLRELQKGKLDASDIARDSIFKMVGALMLLLPGFFSDMLGVLFQFSFFTALIAQSFLKSGVKYKKRRAYEKDENIIDVEVIDDDNNNNDTISRR